MNRLLTKRLGTLLCALSFISTASFSQIHNVDFLRSAPADGAKYLQAYISPWTNAFGAGLNSGWYNTAKPHKFGGFDITTSFNVAFVPSSAGTFELSSLKFSSLTGTGTASTISGPDKSGPSMNYVVNVGGTNYTFATFKAAPGTDWKLIPVPTAQVGIGLPFGTELKARFIPKINIKDGDISLWGVGIVHSIMQYLPGSKLLPFDVSVFGGFTKLQGNVPLSLTPDSSFSQSYATYNPTTSFKDQNMSISVKALNISAIASLNLPVITFYGGLGYCKSQTEMEFQGTYPTPVMVTPALPATPYVQYNDNGVKKGSAFIPKMDIKNFSGLRANIGFRIKLAVITIHADYTRAQYNVVSTGLGLSFR